MTNRFSGAPKGSFTSGRRIGSSWPPSTPSGLGENRTPPGWAPCRLLGRLEAQPSVIQLGENSCMMPTRGPGAGRGQPQPLSLLELSELPGVQGLAQEHTVNGEAPGGSERLLPGSWWSAQARADL